MALPPIAVTEVALSGISRYYNISGITSGQVYLFGNDLPFSAQVKFNHIFLMNIHFK